MMTTEKLVSAWDSCFDKESGWYPPLERGLQGLTASQACLRTDGKEMNTIQELVNHIIFYKATLLSRITGSGNAPSTDTSFNTNASITMERDWQETEAKLKNVHAHIREILVTMGDQELQKELDGTTIYQWVSDLVSHDIYHTGQIIFIRKLQGSWTA
ncbi:DinB family protein [Paenibacillus sp. PL91]|uniref:DinB family protein n=1 Tax=Paenibacillus sp. PL91 TaxID=2729538 RepID=UPI00145CF374|nr:DinB family protein [Paenibacillus sp. PL91]MBC9203677.1 DinB family protein [Paenibacillus sp. PL91]